MEILPQEFISEDFDKTPHKTLAFYRKNHPIIWSSSMRAWIFFKHKDVKEILSDNRFTNNRVYSENFIRPVKDLDNLNFIAEYSPFNDKSSKNHMANRKMAIRVFNASAIARIQKDIRETVEGALKGLLSKQKGSINFCEAAEIIPFEVMRRLLGVPDYAERRNEFIKNCTLLAESFSPLLTDGQLRTCNQAAGEIFKEIYRLIDDRKDTPKNDVLSDFCQALNDFPTLDDKHIVIILSALISSGSRGIQHGITMAVKTLYEHPKQWQILRNDTSLLTNAAIELLRFNGATKFLYRYAKADLTYQGYHFKKGQTVMLSTLSANRDEEAFKDAEYLNITRPASDLKSSLAFGHGRHFCIGSHLAMAQLTSVLAFCIKNIPIDMVDTKGARYQKDFLARALSVLTVTQEKALMSIE